MSDQPTWAEAPDTLRSLAEVDLEMIGHVTPTLIAFKDDEALFLDTLPAFAKGEHTEPIIQALALAVGMGANRLALSLTGRAWSTADPIAPVTEDLDLRATVLISHIVDGTDSVTHINEIRGTSIRDGVTDGSGQGWVCDALIAAATANEPATEAEVIDQILRNLDLGHNLAWGPKAAALLS